MYSNAEKIEWTLIFVTEFGRKFGLTIKQAFNYLTRYKGKEVTRYTFKVTNYEGHEGTVYANVLVWRKKVIGGDICSAEITNGFVQGFEKK